MILAQIDISHIPAGFDNWLMNTVCFAALILMGAAFWRVTRPQPSFEKQIATLRGEFFSALSVQAADHGGAVAALRKETKDELETMRREAVEGRRLLHRDIDEIRQDMADVPERTISLLLKTKELNK